jgi:hypothetical protein
MRHDLRIEPRFQRRVALVKWGLLSLLLALAALTGILVSWQSLVKM